MYCTKASVKYIFLLLTLFCTSCRDEASKGAQAYRVNLIRNTGLRFAHKYKMKLRKAQEGLPDPDQTLILSFDCPREMDRNQARYLLFQAIQEIYREFNNKQHKINGNIITPISSKNLRITIYFSSKKRGNASVLLVRLLSNMVSFKQYVPGRGIVVTRESYHDALEKVRKKDPYFTVSEPIE